ncbi:MAG: aminotransferase class I/II-fold pyridoxal phosphate-dependent enzyme [Gammaproteobacteria bacterium]
MSGQEPVRFVPTLPSLIPTKVVNAAPRYVPFPLSQRSFRYTFSGTAAIAQGLAAMALRPGSKVLCPSYHCGHEIEPFIRAQFQVELYRVQRDLQIDLQDIRDRLKPEVRALLVTHYFGFAQRQLRELYELCRQNGTLLVEDCAHALLSDNPEGNLGRMGDVAIFSFRKTLPVPHGGGFLVNNAELRPPPPPRRPPKLSTLTKAVDLYKKALLQNAGCNHSFLERSGLLLYLPLLQCAAICWRLGIPSRQAWYDPDDEGLEFDNDILWWGMANFCRRLLPGLISPTVKVARCRNWQYLEAKLAEQSRFVPAIRSLLDSTCPLVFPVLVDDRDYWVKRLQAEKIFAAPWWNVGYPKVNWQPFEEARYLNTHMIALPVHQDLSESGLERMANFLLHA